MKFYTRFIHFLVLKFQLEEIFHKLSLIHYFFSRFIPVPVNYQTSTHKTVYRQGVRFNLDRSDYMQWHIYANLPDNSWKSALPILIDNCTILDVGANCGAFSLKLAKHISNKGITNTKIIAFEPNPRNFKNFEINLQLNESLKEITTLHTMALGKENGTCTMSFDSENSGSSHIVSVDNGSIQMIKMDHFMEKNEVKNIRFIKMDVEGFEPDVIQGAIRTIEKFRPTMYIEMTNEWFTKRGSSCKDIINQLHQWEYNLQAEVSNSLVPYEDIEHKIEDYFQYNLLATPK